MEWQKVNSSNLAKVKYVGTALTVEFKSGARYTYKNVPEKVFQDLLEAESKGKYFCRYVRDVYGFEKC